jgi:hypothetical protein
VPRILFPAMIMHKHNIQSFVYVCFFLTTVASCLGETIVFFEKGFPSVENGVISRTVLEQALSHLKPRFVNLTDLKKKDALAKNDLLVLPYGSAFPADAWETIQHHLEKGNLIVLGGRPFFVPVYRDSTGWRFGSPQNTYARYLGIEHSYAVPSSGPLKLQWDDDALFFHLKALNPGHVFALDGHGGRYRGLAFLVDTEGNRISAPVVAEDFVGHARPPRRHVYLS